MPHRKQNVITHWQNPPIIKKIFDFNLFVQKLKQLQQYLFFLTNKSPMKGNLVLINFGFKHWKGRADASYKGINLRKNYYKTLKIQQTNSESLIRKSYLKMAKQLHPDFNPKGHTQFTQLQQAYNVLSNSEFKSYYDRNSQFCMDLKSKQKKVNPDDDLNYKNQQFYQEMKKKGFQGFEREEYEEQFKKEWQSKTSKQQTESQKAQRKIQDEIILARKLLFSRNPLWEKANAYMNYEWRQEQEQQKQKQLQILFPKGSKAMNKFKGWISKY